MNFYLIIIGAILFVLGIFEIAYYHKHFDDYDDNVKSYINNKYTKFENVTMFLFSVIIPIALLGFMLILIGLGL